MPNNESTFSSLGRSLLSIRRDQVPSPSEPQHDPLDLDLESFQRHVADLFAELSPPGDDVLSLHWIRRLLDNFLICQEQFRVTLLLNRDARPALSRPPQDRLLSDSLDRSVKALDLCNAVRDGLDHLRHLLQPLRIVLQVLSSPALSEGHLRRAKRALADFTIAALDDKDSSPSALAYRNRSFGRNSNTAASRDRSSAGRFRSLSWSVSRSWSAGKQLQAMANNLSAPRNNEIAATSGLAVPVFTMNSVLLFVMWTLVAAIPCQDRGLQAHFSVPRSFHWAAPVMSVYERILEESKRKDRKNASGLLKEIHQIEKCVRQLTEVVDSAQVPLSEEGEAELRGHVRELSEVCEAVWEGMEPLERQVREVFHRIVRCRLEGMDCLSASGHH